MGTLRTEPLRARRDHVVIYEDPEVARTAHSVGIAADVELGAGVLASLVAVIGLTGVLPVWMASLAALLIGAGLIARGGVVGARWRRMSGPGVREARAGVAMEILAGFTGVALAAIAPVTAQPATLIGAAALVDGIAMMLGGPEQVATGELARTARRDLVWSSSGALVIIGLASAVLGVLSILAGTADMSLALVALLGVGLGVSFAGAALATRRS